MNTKQTIIIRKDLKMRRGKEIAQGSHASIAWLTNRIKQHLNGFSFEKDLSPEEQDWVNGSFAKVCLQVDSEHELMEIYHKAKIAGLVVSLITDAGRTEFNGVPTVTCIGIGPDEAEKIDKITGGLKLY